MVIIEGMTARRRWWRPTWGRAQPGADGVTGRLVPPRDALAWADACVELLRDPVRRARMGGQRAARYPMLAYPRYDVSTLLGTMSASTRGSQLLQPGEATGVQSTAPHAGTPWLRHLTVFGVALGSSLVATPLARGWRGAVGGPGSAQPAQGAPEPDAPDGGVGVYAGFWPACWPSRSRSAAPEVFLPATTREPGRDLRGHADADGGRGGGRQATGGCPRDEAVGAAGRRGGDQGAGRWGCSAPWLDLPPDRCCGSWA